MEALRFWHWFNTGDMEDVILKSLLVYIWIIIYSKGSAPEGFWSPCQVNALYMSEYQAVLLYLCFSSVPFLENYIWWDFLFSAIWKPSVPGLLCSLKCTLEYVELLLQVASDRFHSFLWADSPVVLPTMVNGRACMAVPLTLFCFLCAYIFWKIYSVLRFSFVLQRALPNLHFAGNAV